MQENEPLKYAERPVQNALWYHLRQKGHKWIMPCFTPGAWWECDMYSVTNSDYAYEFEIKLTVQDFKRDTEKSAGKGAKQVFKHKELLAGKGPRAFYYVVPESLLPELVIPDYAGVLIFGTHRKRIWFKEQKKPRMLHREKVRPAVIQQLLGACYWRFWSERQKP